MNNIYKFGVVIGILALYCLATLGIRCFSAGEDYDMGFFIAWALGVVAFIILAVFTLEKFGLWV